MLGKNCTHEELMENIIQELEEMREMMKKVRELRQDVKKISDDMSSAGEGKRSVASHQEVETY